MKTTNDVKMNVMAKELTATRASAKFGRPLRRAFLLTAAITAAGWFLFAGAARAQSGSNRLAPSAERTTHQSPCEASTSMQAWPEIVPEGAATHVTATLTFNCPGSASAHHHFALVLDASSSIVGGTRAQLINGAKQLVSRLGAAGDGLTKIAVVQFNTDAEVLCELTDQVAMLNECIDGLAAFDSSCIDCGISAAHDALVRGRADLPGGEELTESMIVFTDGANVAGCDAVTMAAADAKADHIRILTIALMPGADVACMRAAATAPRTFFEVRGASSLVNAFFVASQVLSTGRLQRVSLRFTLGSGMAFEEASPQPSQVRGDPALIEWVEQGLPEMNITYTLTLKPLVAGAQPVLASAEGEIVDNQDQYAPITFEIPQIVALSDGVLPTATPRAAMPVRTNDLTLSPPHPKAGQRARLDYRLALDDPIGPLGSHVMIVADASGSMAGEAATRLKSALRDLVARLPLGDDPSMKVGLVTFNNAATLITGPTDGRQIIDDAIESLGAAGGTCIDCGMRVGETALRSGRPAPGVEDMVVFTDGQNSSGCPPVIAIADRLKAADVTVHAVCLVPGGCDTACMRAVASPGHYVEAPRITALAEAFGAVGDVLLSDRRLDAVHLRLLLPPQLRLIPDSFDIAPSSVPSGRESDWTVRPWPRAGLTLRGEVEAIGDADPGAPAVAVAAGVGRDGRAVAYGASAAWPTRATDAAPSRTPNAPSATPTITQPGFVERLYVPYANR